jgi:inhibitor of cysteine peptidase
MYKKIFIKKIALSTNKLVIFLFVFLMTAAVFCSCSIPGNVLDENSNGKSLNLKVNDTIIIRLQSNATTGFKWNLPKENNSGIISLVSSDYTEKENKENLVGTGGFETFTFKTVSKGSATLTLTYNRPWEKDVQPEKIFKLNITVQ